MATAPYVINPDDPTNPTENLTMGAAAAELRGLKQRVLLARQETADLEARALTHEGANPYELDAQFNANENKITELPLATEASDAVPLSQVLALIGAAGSGIVASVRQEWIAIEGQTVFTLTLFSYVPTANNIAVYVDGIRQDSGTAYVETNSTSFTFTEGLKAGSVVHAFSNESVDADAVALLRADLATTGAGKGAEMVAFKQAGSGSVATNVQSKLRDVVCADDFGVIGDGVTNTTTKFVEADAYAASIGAKLFIKKPAVAYFGNGFKPTTDWVCEPGTVFLNSNRAATGGSGYQFFVVQHDVYIENVIADANRINNVTGTSDIPAGGWNSSNFDAFTGGAAIVIDSGASPVMFNCEGRNSGGRPVWNITNASPKLYNCKAKGGRGNFGDGYYLGTCTNAVLVDCESEDVTRINFVSESKSRGTKFIRPIASNAHDQGINYGGTEFNGSIWLEHTVGSVVDHPDADNAFIIGGASRWTGEAAAREPLTLIGGRSASMKLSSAAVDVFGIEVASHKTGQIEYSVIGKQVVTMDGVYAKNRSSLPTGANGAILLSGEVAPSTLNVRNCTLQVYETPSAQDRGHLAYLAKLPSLTVENTVGLDASGDKTPLLIGSTSGASVTTGAIKVRNSDVRLWGNYWCGGISFDGFYSVVLDNNVNAVAPLYFGEAGVVKTNSVANSSRLFVYKDITLKGKIQNVRLRMIGDASKSIADFSGATFEYDMNTFTGVMQFSEANWRYVDLIGAVFRNTNTVSIANNYWLESGSTAPLWLPANVYASNTVTYSIKSGAALENITGFTAVAI